MRRYIFCFLLGFNFIFAMYGQSRHLINRDTIKIKEVIITGTTNSLNKNVLPFSISIISRDIIKESQESNLLGALSGRVPGLFVTERGITGFGVANGSAGQISIRGIGGSPTTGVLILIDGHPQVMGLMGHPLADSYVASDAERVEVIRGPGSLLYGSNAMGGVINIITRKPSLDGFNGDANFMAGSYQTMKWGGSAGYKNKGLSFFGSVNHDQTDGHRANSYFSITNGYFKMNYEMNTHLRIGSDFSLSNFKSTDPGPDTINASVGNSLDIHRGYWSTFIDHEYEHFSGSVKLFYNFGEHTISDGFYSRDHNYGINFSEVFKFQPNTTFSIGGDFIRYGGRAKNTKLMNGQGIMFVDTTLTDSGIFATFQQTLFGKLSFQGGVRLQVNEKYGSIWIPSAGFSWEVKPGWFWKGSVSKGFRSPTIRELYMWNHNSDLQPEQMMSYETGFTRTFFDGKLNTELTGYIMTGNNLIMTDPLGKYFNSSSVDNKGVELALNSRPLDHLSFNMTYSYIHMQSPLYGAPRHNLFVSGRYDWKKWSLVSSFNRISHLDTDPTVNTHFEGYMLVNSKLFYRLNRRVELYMSAENLLNQHYENIRYYALPGRIAFGGIHLKFN